MMNKKLNKAIEVYLKRGIEAQDDIRAILESVWVDHNWGFTEDGSDQGTGIQIAILIEDLVLNNPDVEDATQKAKLLQQLL